jgi:mono/diheme cytochrome c family protein
VRCILVGLAVFALWIGSAAAAPCPTPFRSPLTYQSIVALVSQAGIGSIDDLLECLPAEYRRHFTLVYRSRSPERDSIDPLHPRVILFGLDARLLLAFTGDAKKPFYDRLQLIEFREEGRFFFAEMLFDGKGASIHEAPPECSSCHAADGHPIWDTYDLWPGAYGSSNDRLPVGTPERRSYESFLAKSRHHGRYASLNWLTKSPVAPYHDDDTFDPDLFPNLRLNKLLSRYNAKRVFRQIRQSPRYDAEKVRLVRGLLGCDPFAVPTSLEKSIREALQDAFQLKMRRNKAFAPSLNFNAGYYATGSARAVQVAQLLDVDTKDWALTLEPGSYDFQDGDATLDDFLLTEMYRDLARELPELGALVTVVDEGARRQEAGIVPSDFLSGRSRYRSYDPVYASLGGALSRSKARPACALLGGSNPSSASPSDASSVAFAPITTVDDSVIASAPDAADNVLQRFCASCHGGKQPSSTRYPLEDPAEMRKMLSANSKLVHDFLKRIESRGEDRMPPRQSLTPPERAALGAYVRSLSE